MQDQLKSIPHRFAQSTTNWKEKTKIGVTEAHSSNSHITHTLVRGRGSNSCGRQERLNPLLLTVHTPLLQGIYAAKSFEQTWLALGPLKWLCQHDSHIVIRIHICSLLVVLNCSHLIQGFTADWPHTQLSPSLGTAFSQNQQWLGSWIKYHFSNKSQVGKLIPSCQATHDLDSTSADTSYSACFTSASTNAQSDGFQFNLSCITSYVIQELITKQLLVVQTNGWSNLLTNPRYLT
jgi:hypothetical protein